MSIAARLERVEGRKPYMYLCTAGKVTVGVGHVLAQPRDAAALPFTDGIDDDLAPQGLIQCDYATVAAAQVGLPASAYEHLTKCRLPDDVITRLRDADIQKFLANIRRALPYYSDLPSPAREALFDLAFNCGVTGLMRFQKMLYAIERHDWKTAAAESHRKGISQERNREIAQLLLAAGDPTAVQL